MLYGRISGLVLSLFLPEFYRRVARNWGGIGILYLLLLFMLTWIPALVNIHQSARRFAQEDFPKFAKDVPEINIKGGKFSSPVPQPYEIKDEGGNVVFVLDTTGKINNIEQTKAVFLITKTKVWQRDPHNGQIQIHDIGQMNLPDFDFTAEWLQGWVETITTWLAVWLYPFCILGSMIRALILMLLASLAGLIVNNAFNAKVTYGGLMRFGAVGMTLSVYISTGLDLAGVEVPFYFFIALALTCVYVGFGCFVSVPELAEVDYQREKEEDDWERRPRRADDGYGEQDDENGGIRAGEPR